MSDIRYILSSKLEYGYHTQGPIDYIRRFETAYVADKLRAILEKYGNTIFAPAQTLVIGAYLR